MKELLKELYGYAKALIAVREMTGALPENVPEKLLEFHDKMISEIESE